VSLLSAGTNVKTVCSGRAESVHTSAGRRVLFATRASRPHAVLSHGRIVLCLLATVNLRLC